MLNQLLKQISKLILVERLKYSQIYNDRMTVPKKFNGQKTKTKTKHTNETWEYNIKPGHKKVKLSMSPHLIDSDFRWKSLCR